MTVHQTRLNSTLRSLLQIPVAKHSADVQTELDAAAAELPENYKRSK